MDIIPEPARFHQSVAVSHHCCQNIQSTLTRPANRAYDLFSGSPEGSSAGVHPIRVFSIITSLPWNRRAKNTITIYNEPKHTETTFPGEGDLPYAIDRGENYSAPCYQEPSGAPVEARPTLSYIVGPITTIFLNVSKMVGMGVYSMPASVLTNTRSVGLSCIYWFIGFLIAASSLSVYFEFASYYPNSSEEARLSISSRHIRVRATSSL